MIAFIVVNILIFALLAGAVVDYFKLKKHIPKDQRKDPTASIPIIDVLFNQSLRDNPDARKIQKRAVWCFCLSLLLVHASREIYETQVKEMNITVPKPKPEEQGQEVHISSTWSQPSPAVMEELGFNWETNSSQGNSLITRP